MGDIDENGKYVPVRATIFSANKTDSKNILNQEHHINQYQFTNSSHTSYSISTQNTTSINNHENSRNCYCSSTSYSYPSNEELDFMLYLELLKRKEQRELETLEQWNKTVPWKQKKKSSTSIKIEKNNSFPNRNSSK